MKKKHFFIAPPVILAFFAAVTLTNTASANTAPTFVGNSSSTWSVGGATQATGNVLTQTGDFLVVYAGCEDQGSCGTLSVTSTPTLTWDLSQSGQLGSYAPAYIWTSTSTSGGNVKVTVSHITGARGGADLLVFRNTGGFGNNIENNGASGNPGVNLATTASDSAIVAFDTDWTPSAGTGTWSTAAGSFTALDDVYISGAYAVHGGYYPDASSTRTYSVGMTAPTGQKWQIVALEILGSTSTPVAAVPHTSILTMDW